MSNFPLSIYCGKDSLLRSGCVNDSEIAFLYKYKGMSWLDISLPELSCNWECIFFLSEKGLLFVLPAFIELYQSGVDPDISSLWREDVLKKAEYLKELDLFNSEQFEFFKEMLK